MASVRRSAAAEAARTLSAQLEAALCRELLLSHAELNAAFFKRALKSPTLELTDSSTHLGRWQPDTRTLEISRALVLEQPWGTVLEVLKHEMAHQYVHEVLHQTDEPAHGPAFRQVCERFGIDASASGMPASSSADGDERVLTRITKLLALAESANVHEAEAAMAAAQRLMLKYNLDSVAAGAQQRDYGFRHLGSPTGRVAEHQRLLAAIVGEHFFVEVIWVPVYRPLEGRRGSVLEICGTPGNLEMAAYVHDFLARTAEQLWRDHKRAHRIRGNRDRRSYLSGVMAGFLEKLRRQKAAHREQGLVWVRDGDLARFYRRRHPHIQHARYAGNRRSEAHAHGREAGRKIVLHRPIQAAAVVGGRLLPR